MFMWKASGILNRTLLFFFFSWHFWKKPWGTVFPAFHGSMTLFDNPNVNYKYGIQSALRQQSWHVSKEQTLCYGAEMSYFSLVPVVTWLCLHRGMNQESLSLQIALVQSDHTEICIAAAEDLPVPQAVSVPLQHSPVYHWLWHRASTASQNQVGEAQWFLALPPQLLLSGALLHP